MCESSRPKGFHHDPDGDRRHVGKIPLSTSGRNEGQYAARKGHPGQNRQQGPGAHGSANGCQELDIAAAQPA